MGNPELGLVIAMGGMAGLAALAHRLIWSIWVGGYPRPGQIGIPLVLAILAITLLAAGSPAADPVLVAGAATQESANRIDTSGIHVHHRVERVTIAGPLAATADHGIWAALEDLRTGTLWLQGPASQDDTSWSLELVAGTGGDQSPPYRVTAFAVSAETSAAWQAAALKSPHLTLGALPPETTWLGRPVILGNTSGPAA